MNRNVRMRGRTVMRMSAWEKGCESHLAAFFCARLFGRREIAGSREPGAGSGVFDFCSQAQDSC